MIFFQYLSYLFIGSSSIIKDESLHSGHDSVVGHLSPQYPLHECPHFKRLPQTFSQYLVFLPLQTLECPHFLLQGWPPLWEQVMPHFSLQPDLQGSSHFDLHFLWEQSCMMQRFPPGHGTHRSPQTPNESRVYFCHSIIGYFVEIKKK